jgi:hypothetical protein
LSGGSTGELPGLPDPQKFGKFGKFGKFDLSPIAHDPSPEWLIATFRRSDLRTSEPKNAAP